MPAFLPSSLARRFALAAAGLATMALLVTFAASWWLIDRQHEQQLAQLATKEREFHAAAASSQLQELAGRMSEVAANPMLASALAASSAGKETQLESYLAALRQVNGVPVQVIVTDAEGSEIASNSAAAFSSAEISWLRQRIVSGLAESEIFLPDQSPMTPMLISRPEPTLTHLPSAWSLTASSMKPRTVSVT
jgi:hypothetical protein